MTRVFLLAVALLVLTDCGIKRPLIAPKDIPAYEAKRQKRMEKMNEEDDSADRPEAASPPATQGQ